MTTTSLSVLDLSPIPSGSTAGEALRDSIALAQHAEALGFRRYWLAEHHNAGGLACPAPEIMIGQIAAATRSIRVEQFLDDDAPPREAFTGTVRAIPTNVPSPEMWMLGSSEAGGALLAAERGLGFAFAHHINPADSARALRRYREAFVPSRHRRAPWAILAVAVVCAETDAIAERLASSGELATMRFIQGIRDRPLPSVDDALAYEYDAEELALRGGRTSHVIVGGVARVRDRLRSLIEASGADEIMVTTHIHAHDARKRSYALVAEALGLRALRTADLSADR